MSMCRVFSCEEGVCCDQCILLAKLYHELIPLVGVSCPTISDSRALQEKGPSQLGARKTLSFILLLEVYTFLYFHPLPLSSPPLATTIWWSIYEFLIPRISDITRYLPFTLSFIIWLSTMPSRSIHVVTNGKYSFKDVCVCKIFSFYFLYPFICWWTIRLFLFHFLTIANNATMNMEMQVSFQDSGFVSFR